MIVLALTVNMDPEQGSSGTRVTIEVEESGVDEYSDFISAEVTGQPFYKKLEPSDEKGKFKTEATVPMGAPAGTYNIKFKSQNGEEETKEFKVVY